jgi:hypothetical protein
MLEILGWIATAMFAVSYLFKDPRRLRFVQAVAAIMWIAYGIALHAMPVVLSNLIVALVAGYSSLRPAQAEQARP